MGRPHDIGLWIEEAAWCAITIAIYVINLIQLVGDARDDAKARDKKTVSGRASRASGKIQRIFHRLSIVCAVLMPAKLLEITDFDSYELVLITRIPDIIISLLTYVCFHCACYYTAYHAFLVTEKHFDSVPKWFFPTYFIVGLIVVVVGLAMEAMGLIINKQWPYSIFVFTIAAAITAMYVAALVCGFILKKRLEQIRRRSHRGSITSTLQMQAKQQQTTKFTRFLRFLKIISVFVPVIITLSIFQALQNLSREDDLIRPANSDPGLDYSYWLSGSFLLLGSWYSWEPLKPGTPEDSRADPSQANKDSHGSKSSHGAQQSPNGNMVGPRGRQRNLSGHGTAGRRNMLRLNARKGARVGTTGSIDIESDRSRQSRAGSMTLKEALALPIEPASPAHRGSEALIIPTNAANSASASPLPKSGYGSVKFHRKSRREGSRNEPVPDGGHRVSLALGNLPSSSRDSVASLSPLILDSPHEPNSAKTPGPPPDTKADSHSSTSASASTSNTLMQSLPLPPSAQSRAEPGSSSNTSPPKTVVLHIPDSFLKS